MTVVSEAEAAARLVALGMRPKQLPARDAVYADLVGRCGRSDQRVQRRSVRSRHRPEANATGRPGTYRVASHVSPTMVAAWWAVIVSRV